MRAANSPVNDSPVVQIFQSFQSVPHYHADEYFAHAIRFAQVAGRAQITEWTETPDPGMLQKGSDEWQQVLMSQRPVQPDSSHQTVHFRITQLFQVQDFGSQNRAPEQDTDDSGCEG